MTYQIGQIVPHDAAQVSYLGSLLAVPAWHILRVRSGSERQSADELRHAGVHVCYPTDDRAWRDARGKVVRVKVPSVAGYIFAKFDRAPFWTALRARRIITGMVCRETPWGPVPYRATENDVRRFMGIPTVEEELEAARREELRVRPGDRARVLVGSDLALAVRVTGVSGGMVFWETDTGIKGSTSEDRSERAA
ncbi:transcription termination/antitermination NusG family protein [Mameliella alba]|uniref:transcription termination/antitermination NusG family protein n=1 Tax=Mameliella alba TaxID=561184 RepID=UPI000B52F247|nr:transcription termination/antitermination NusG family protein [Mameliella alba]OWV44217.1 hypothetical protein CDZ95_05905 [Mameliella alba]